MNILVLENVTSLDNEISCYLKKEHAKDEVNILYRLQSVAKDKLIEALSSCDIICIQSTFYDREQLKNFIKLLPTFDNIKELRVIYTYNNPADNNQFLRFLNFSITEETQKDLKYFLSKIKLSEVLCKTVELDKSEYFRKLDVIYNIVPIYYNSKADLFWHTFQPVIDRTGERFYLKNDVKVIEIERKDVKVFKDILQKLRAVIEHQKESCELHDFGDSKKLIKEKEKWLEILDKYKL